MKKKLLALFFMSVMLLSLASLTAHAVHEIPEIKIQNLRTPVAGNRPDYDIDFFRIDLQTRTMSEFDTVNGIVWYEMKAQSGTQNIKLIKMSKSDQFEIGKSYFVRIFVWPKYSDRVFAKNVSASIYDLNADTEEMEAKAASATTVSGADNVMVVEATYKCEKKSIVAVEITGLKLPKSGEHPDDDCNVLTEGVYLNGKVTWTHKTGKNSYETMAYDDVFVEGETYKYSIWLKTEFEKGFWFRTDAKGENIADVMVNGIIMGEDNICDTWDIDYIRNVEYEYYVPLKTIRNIDIVGIAAPVAGIEPDYEAFPTTAGYDIDIFWVNETLMQTLIDGGTPRKDAFEQAVMVKGDGKTFEAGNKYKISVEAKPQDGYEIDYDPNDYDILDFAATVNGMDAKESSGYKGDNASFEYSFGNPSVQTIFNIDVTVDTPKAGAVPDYEAVCGADSYKVTYISWSDVTERDALIAGGMTYVDAAKQTMLKKGDGKTFKAGHVYSVNIEATPEKNYEIDYDGENILYFSATVNGFDASEGSGYRGESANFSYTFEHICAHTVINKSNASCTKAGYTGDEICSVCKTVFKEGEKIKAKGHIYKTTTTKATLTKNGKIEIKCSVCGDAEIIRNIYIPKTASLSATKYLYDGKTKTPSLTVKDSKGNKLVKGTDYTISVASARKNVGKYTVTVKFKGNYSGEKKLYFYILPNKTTKMTATQNTSAILTKWAKVTGADGYAVEIYDANNKKLNTKYTTALELKYSGLKAGTVYKIKVIAYKVIDGKKVLSTAGSVITTATKPATPTLKATSPSKGKLSLSWTNVSGETGYVIQYSTKKDSGFKKLTDTKANVVSFSKSVTSGKTYYFRVKSYKKVGDTYIYSSYSDVKGVKIK